MVHCSFGFVQFATARDELKCKPSFFHILKDLPAGNVRLKQHTADPNLKFGSSPYSYYLNWSKEL